MADLVFANGMVEGERGRERVRVSFCPNNLPEYELLFLFALSDDSDFPSRFSLWCSYTHHLKKPFRRASAGPVSVTGSGKLAAWHATHHFKATVKREIALWEPHALVSLYKNFVQSEGKVLRAKWFVVEKMAIRAKSTLLLKTQGSQEKQEECRWSHI